MEWKMKMTINVNDCYEGFAKSLCKIKNWPEQDCKSKILIAAIKNGAWDFELAIWIEGRQTVLDELKNAGHSFGGFTKHKFNDL